MFLTIALIVAVPAIVVVALTIIMGRTKVTRSGEFDEEALSFTGGVLNAVFVVVLAFYVVFSWQVSDDIESHAMAEADALLDIHWQAESVPAADRSAIRSLTERYATEVVDHEWEMLAGDRTDPAMREIITELRARILALSADSETGEIAREQALRAVQQLHENHRARVHAVIDESPNAEPFTWVLLSAAVVGAVLMIVFPLAIGITARRRHVLVMVLLTVMLGALMYFCVDLMDPLQGLLAEDPDPFRTALEELSTE